jgi:hypothetical protein
MKYLDSYGTYEAANDCQITLLAASIDALVEFVPTSVAELQHAEARRPGYALMVEDERFEEAAALLSVEVQPDYKCLYACPKCQSERVIQKDIPMFLGIFFSLYRSPSKWR